MAHDMPGPSAGPSRGGRPDVADLGAADSAEGPQAAPEHGKSRKLLYVTLPGCWGALIAGCLSFTPSLLPRGGIVQGVIWGITAAIGYGLGVLAAWIWRGFADRAPGACGAGPGRSSSSVPPSWWWCPSGSGSTGSMRSAS